ncbi:cell division protein ZapA [bacterium]|nr:cell division protein ZapA [bacterium]
MGEAEAETIQITVADQILRVRATPGERERFERAAANVNAIIKDIVAGGGVVGGPRLMAMVAFELGVTLDEAREALAEAKGTEREARDRITDLIKRIEAHTKSGFKPEQK